MSAAEQQAEQDGRLSRVRDRVQRGIAFRPAYPGMDPDAPETAVQPQGGPIPQARVSIPPEARMALLSILMTFLGVFASAIGTGMVVGVVLGPLAGLGAGIAVLGILVFGIGVQLGKTS